MEFPGKNTGGGCHFLLQGIFQTQRQDNPKAKHSKNILVKLTNIKHKEKILKAAREKQQIIHKGIPINITADLSIETFQANREWQDTLKVMKEKN